MSEIQTIDAPKPNLPQLFDHADFDIEAITNLTHYAYLTPTQRIVLIIMSESMCSDLLYTETEIAEKAGVSRKTITNCKHNAHFLDCLSQITKNIAKSHIQHTVKALQKAVEKGNIRAIDLMMRYTGDFIPTQRNENLNATIPTRPANMNLSEAVSEFVAQLADKGLSLERIHDAIDEAYLALRDQQRIA